MIPHPPRYGGNLPFIRPWANDVRPARRLTALRCLIRALSASDGLLDRLATPRPHNPLPCARGSVKLLRLGSVYL